MTKTRKLVSETVALYVDLFEVAYCGERVLITGPTDAGHLVEAVNAKLEPFETGGHGYDLDALAFNLECLQMDVANGEVAAPVNSDELVDAIVADYRASIAETAKLKGVPIAKLFA